MTISRIWSVRAPVRSSIEYITDINKTRMENIRSIHPKYEDREGVLRRVQGMENVRREYFCEGINCTVENAEEEFMMIKERFSKTGGVQAHHGMISFRDQDISAELALQAGRDFVSQVWGDGFQIVLAAHLNTQYLHCHYLANSISFKTGKRPGRDILWWTVHYEAAKRISHRYGLYFDDSFTPSIRMYAMSALEKKGYMTKNNIRRIAIDESIRKSGSVREFIEHMKHLGYRLEYSQSNGEWVICDLNGKNPIHLSWLGERYQREDIEKRIRKRDREYFVMPEKKSASGQYCMRTKEEYLRELDTLEGVFLYHEYLLRKFARSENPEISRVPSAIRDELLYYEQIRTQAKILCAYHIKTDTQLEGFICARKELVNRLKRKRYRIRYRIGKEEDDTVYKNTLLRERVKINEKLAETRIELHNLEYIKKNAPVYTQRRNEIRKDQQHRKEMERV